MSLEHERQVLESGVTLLARPLDSNDIVALRAALPMGPLYEDDDEAGVSRLVQKVIVRGTERRSNRELQEALAALGADLDAGTGADLGSVTARATGSTWKDALDLLLETIVEPAFAPDELEIEIERTLAAIEAREDRLLTRAMDLFRDRFYGEHPFHKPTIGTREAVKRVDRERLLSAARRFYRPVPPVVVAVGRFDPERLVERVDRAFGGEALVPPEPRPEPPEPGRGTCRLEVDREAAYVVLGHSAPDLADPEYAASQVVAAILGGSMDSRLFVELREKRALAYQVSSLYDDRLDGSFLIGYIVTDPARVSEAIEGLAGEFRRLIDEPVGEEEIERTRRHLRGRYRIAAETNAAQAARLGSYECYALGQDFGDRWLADLDAVTPESIRIFATRWLSGEPTCAIVTSSGPGS